MSKETQQAEYYFKLLSILFLAYCVLQSISGKPCSGCFRHLVSPENLVYEVEEQDTQIDDVVGEDDRFDFSMLLAIAPQPLITLRCYSCKIETLPLFTPYDPYALSDRSPPLFTIC